MCGLRRYPWLLQLLFLRWGFLKLRVEARRRKEGRGRRRRRRRRKRKDGKGRERRGRLVYRHRGDSMAQRREHHIAKQID